MIRPNKLSNALYALQGVLIRARTMAYEDAPRKQLADLLDTAELLPSLIASEVDETESFRGWMAEVSSRHRCAFVLERFDEPPPANW